MATLFCELLTPEHALRAGEAIGVVLRTSDGDLTVLSGHTPLVGDVVPGVVRVLREDEAEHFVVHGGFVQVATARGAAAGLIAGVGDDELSTRVTLLAGVAEPLESVDVVRATAARDAASAALAELGAPDDDEERAARRLALEGALARAELRLAATGAAGQ